MVPHLTFEEISSEDSFNPLLIDPSSPFTQGYFYGDWQKSLGRTVKRFLIKSNNDVLCSLQLIKYPLLRGKNYLYAPYGPVMKEFSAELLASLRQKLGALAEEENAIFVRLDFTPAPNEAQQALIEKFFNRSPFCTYRSPYFQPRTEWILDLKKSETDLPKEMNPKTRYGIKAAEKRGIKIEIIDRGILKYFDDFYALMEETAARNKFGLHPKEYYKNIFANSEGRKDAYLVVSRYKGRILVVDFMLLFGTTANYVFSGSSSEHRNLMPSYLAQWEAIRHAKRLGCAEYNFGGISGGIDVRKEWEGLTFFKTRFGGEARAHSNFYDIVADPLWYHLYSFRKFVKKIIL